ncbi:hypothetical protein HPP92_007261 [Vanilla planifolia]|nr:hypothetical protein HPP92_007261 [Vanilla planifolia]
MVATVRCEEIANEKISSFSNNEEWRHLEEAVQNGVVPGFGKKLSSILDDCLTEYDMEAIYFDDGVRTSKRKQLESKLLQLVHPAYQSMLGHLRSKTMEDFRATFEKALERGEGFAAAVHHCTQSLVSKFDEGCKDAAIAQAHWNCSKVRDKVWRDFDAHVASVRAAKLSELTSFYEEKLKKALAEPLEALLDAPSDDTWSAIRRLLVRETRTTVSEFDSSLSAFDIDQAAVDQLLAKLKQYAKNIVESKAKEEAGRVLIRMKDRFSNLFSHDSDSMPRMWTGKEDIRAITKSARLASLKLLSVVAAIRLDDEKDSIESTLSHAFMDASYSSTNRSIQLVDPLVSSSWNDVPANRTLITPVQCKSLWRQFNAETEHIVAQAIATQEANKRNNNWLPPPWAIVAMVILGFNEFMTLLRNPFYVGVLFVSFLLGKALWVQLNVSGELQRGALPGLLSLSTKFLPTIMNILKKLAELGEGQRPNTREARRVPELEADISMNRVESSSISSIASSEVTSSETGVEHTSPEKHSE